MKRCRSEKRRRPDGSPPARGRHGPCTATAIHAPVSRDAPLRILLVAAALAVGAGTSAGRLGAQDAGDAPDVASGGSTAESTFLLVPIGPRTVGLGRAVAAERAEAEGVFWNPASLAGLERSRLFVLFSNDFGTESQVIGFVARAGAIRAAAAFHRLDLGSIQATDASGQRLGEIEIRDQALHVSASASLVPRVQAGITYKLIQFVSDCRGMCEDVDLTATAHAFDIGAIAALPAAPGLDVGVVLRNVGTRLALGDDRPSDPLPARLRVGASWSVFGALPAPQWAGEAPMLVVRADVEEPWPEIDDLDAFFGAELGYEGLVFARVGYAAASAGRTGPALGIGIAYDRFRLDIGRSFDDFSGFEGTPFQIGLEIEL